MLDGKASVVVEQVISAVEGDGLQVGITKEIRLRFEQFRGLGGVGVAHLAFPRVDEGAGGEVIRETVGIEVIGIEPKDKAIAWYLSGVCLVEGQAWGSDGLLKGDSLAGGLPD